jgi:hypothetical protein
MRAFNDFGFQINHCDTCLNDENESDELILGKPKCKIEGICKHFGNARKDEIGDLIGCPLDWLSQGGLAQFETISDRIISLSAWDGVPLPTISFYPYACGDVDMTEDLFQELLEIKINAFRMETLRERSRAQKRASHGVG